MVKAAIYARISSDREGGGLGVDRQVADCRELAVKLGWEVHDVYVDNDVSAWSGKPRPDYRRLCGDISGGAVDALLVWHTDRLHRHPRELEEFIDLCEAAGDIPIDSVISGDLDLSTSSGKVMARVKGAFAAQESDVKSERTARKHLEIATKGEVSGGGTRPYGFAADRLRVVAKEAGHIRKAADRVLAGDSVRSVCVDFNEQGITTSTGRPWTNQTMKRMLVSARISGRREHKGEIVADAVWPAIISPEDSDRLRALLNRSAAASRSGRSPRSYLLTAGLIRCGLCDTPMVSRPRGDKTPSYVCSSEPGIGGCGRMATMAEPVESLARDAVLQRIDNPELAAVLADTRRANTELEELHTQIAADEQKLDLIATEYGEDAISARQWAAARKPVQQRLDVAKRRLSRISATHRIDQDVVNSKALADTWDELTISRRQAIIKTVLDHIAVAPGVKGRNTFDPNRFNLIWRL